MRVDEVLATKGSDVACVAPTDTVSELVQRLAELRYGAMIVSPDGRTVTGIVSERDVVRRLADQGPQLLDQTVASIMTERVHCCGPDHSMDDLMALMTDRRVRHVPVLVDGELAGVVSIGDVVKHRVAELEDANYHLERFVTTGW